MKKKVVFTLFITSFLLSGAYLFNQKFNDGFNLRQIHSSLQMDFCNTALEENQLESICALFQKPFYYIGKGCQFYAFESSDHSVVLKFFKQKHLRPISCPSSLPNHSKIRTWIEKRQGKIISRKKALFSSCQIAKEILSLETGVFYVHLQPSRLFNQQITLVDKLGLKHKLFIDDFEFVLQKKGIPAKTALVGLNKEELVEEKVFQLVELVQRCCVKGVRDLDKAFIQNVAFAEDKALLIDIGQFTYGTYSEEEIQKEVKKRLDYAHLWAKENAPYLAPYIEKYKSN